MPGGKRFLNLFSVTYRRGHGNNPRFGGWLPSRSLSLDNVTHTTVQLGLKITLELNQRLIRKKHQVDAVDCPWPWLASKPKPDASVLIDF